MHESFIKLGMVTESNASLQMHNHAQTLERGGGVYGGAKWHELYLMHIHHNTLNPFFRLSVDAMHFPLIRRKR